MKRAYNYTQMLKGVAEPRRRRGREKKKGRERKRGEKCCF